jgi:hypothetical protein
MATTANDTSLPTLVDVIKTQDPDGTTAKVVEVLAQQNSLLQDAVFVEANGETGHQVTEEMALPAVAWRRFNKGTPPSKGADRQFVETAGMLEGWSVVDSDLAKLNGNEASYRYLKDRKFMRSMANEVETGGFYHSTESAPEKFQGLSPRYDSTSGLAGSQIILHTGSPSGAQASIWLLVWSPESVFFFYPKGSQGGLVHKDLGEIPWEDEDGDKFMAYVSNWKWHTGLCVADRRQAVRIANIDRSALVTTDLSLINTMVDAYHSLYDPDQGRAAFYCDREIGAFLHKQALNGVSNSTLRIEEIGGKPVTSFLGIPVRRADALTDEDPIT